MRMVARFLQSVLTDSQSAALTPQIMRMLDRIHIYEVLPRQWVFVHTHDGVRAALAELAAQDGGENGDMRVIV